MRTLFKLATADVILGCPVRTEVVVFDTHDQELFSKIVLPKTPFYPLPVRRFPLFISFRLLLSIFRTATSHWRMLIKPRLLYYVALLRTIRPKVVLTWIDNNSFFQQLWRHAPEMKFIAIQNGARSAVSMISSHQTPIDMPTYYVWGHKEEKLLADYGHEVQELLFASPLLGGYFYSKVKHDSKKTFDICLVSQWRSSVMNGNALPHLKAAMEHLNQLLRELIDRHGMRMIVATATDETAEYDFYKLAFPNAHIQHYLRGDFSSYRAIASSRLSVGIYSTALSEAFANGERVLFCRLFPSEIDSLYFSEPMPPNIRLDNLKSFPEKVTCLLKVSEEEYAAETATARNYLFPSGMPADIIIRERIERELCAHNVASGTLK